MNHDTQKSETPVAAGEVAKQNTESAVIVAAGAFPDKTGSVKAEFLADLLERKKITQNYATENNNTSRAASAKHQLCDAGWPIENVWTVVGTGDGRVKKVALYVMPEDAITRAYACGAAAWIARVREARKKGREQAPKAYKRAARINAARATANRDRFTFDLFGEGPA